MFAKDWRLEGYSQGDTLREVSAAIEGARTKGFAPPENSRLNSPTLETWPSLYETFDAKNIPRRRWIYDHHYIRGFVSVLASAGGVGKTSLQICEGLAIASGRPLLGETVHERTNVWVINLEDPLEEMQLRVVAAMQAHGVTQEEIEGRLFVDAGRDFQILFAEQGPKGLSVNNELSDMMIRKIRDNNIGAVFIDLFVGSHAVNENDNMAVNAVVSQIRHVADATNSAIGLVHHIRKSNGQDANIDSVRGAVSLIGAARVARVVNKISKEDAAKLGIDENTAKSVFRVENGKANLSPPAENSVWRKMTGVQLSNGEWVGVTEEYHPPSLKPVSEHEFFKVQKAINRTAEPVKCAESAKDWAGYTAAEALGVDIGRGPKADRSHEQEIERVKMRKLIRDMEKFSFIKKSKIYDKRNSRDVRVYEVGNSIHDAFKCGEQPQSAE
ncbi:AAA family ATPase [Parasedimentitalea denitrificans]|nr:AAA family ATPase [Sedimentitalea sp. CY04]